MNPVYYHKFPKEAYMLLWYLADIYTVGVIVHKSELLRYFAKYAMNGGHPLYGQLCKWLTKFKDVSWWQENIRANNAVEVFVTFRITTTYEHEEDGMVVRKHYDAHVHKDFSNNFHDRALMMTWMNGLDECEVDDRMLCPWTAHWHNRDVFPVGFSEEIQQVLARFHLNNSWPNNARMNPDTSIRYIEGTRTNVYAWVSTDSESDGDNDYG